MSIFARFGASLRPPRPEENGLFRRINGLGEYTCIPKTAGPAAQATTKKGRPDAPAPYAKCWKSSSVGRIAANFLFDTTLDRHPNGEKKVSSVSKIYSGAAVEPLVRRLPAPVAGVDLNFCRNTACALYGVRPDPFSTAEWRTGSAAGRASWSSPGRQAQRVLQVFGLRHILAGEEQPRGRGRARADAPAA